MDKKVIVKGLTQYVEHMNKLVNQALTADEEFSKTKEGKLLIQTVLFTSGMAEQSINEHGILLEDDFNITHEEYIEVLLAHAKTINNIRELDEDLDVDLKNLLLMSYELTVEQAKAVAAFVAREFKTLQDIEKRGVVEVENVPLYNADAILEQDEYKPKNEAQKLLHGLFSGKSKTIKID
jgi:hypothetical protein